ncbi:MAG TPA: hypothetical protein PKK91_04970, partial [bacterium]|nr:hypothetical protein [bacterium]
DTSINWQDFYKIHQIAEEIYTLIEKKNVSRSLLYVLYAGYEEEKLLSNKKIKKIPYVRIWRIFYAIKRFMERHKQKEIQEELDEIRKQFISDFRLQPNLNTAVRWAELLTTKEKGEKNEQ